MAWASSKTPRHRGGVGRGRGAGNQHPDRGPSSDIALSKALSWLLRHNAVSEGLAIDSGGWVRVQDVLSHRNFASWTAQDITRVVATNDKKRFSLRGEGPSAEIRANQGHSLEEIVDENLLQRVTDPDETPVVIHGTYRHAWDAIRGQGLSRMTRNHIHFTAGVDKPGEKVVSGLRASAEIHIFVDVKKAMEDGIKFFRSTNNVILCPGDENGVLGVKYFLKVLLVRTGKDLLEDKQ